MFTCQRKWNENRAPSTRYTHTPCTPKNPNINRSYGTTTHYAVWLPCSGRLSWLFSDFWYLCFCVSSTSTGRRYVFCRMYVSFWVLSREIQKEKKGTSFICGACMWLRGIILSFWFGYRVSFLIRTDSTNAKTWIRHRPHFVDNWTLTINTGQHNISWHYVNENRVQRVIDKQGTQYRLCFPSSTPSSKRQMTKNKMMTK